MATLRIGLFVENQITAGGAFQQTLSAIQAISKHLSSHEVVIMTTTKDNVKALQEKNVQAELFNAGPLVRFFDSLSGLMPRLDVVLTFFQRVGLRHIGCNLDFRLKELRIDIALFNARSATALRLSTHPFVITVWDICHRDFPEFPEVSYNREFERREQLLKALLPKALAVIVNAPSEIDDIANLYQINRERIVLIPFLPSVAVRRHSEGLGTTSSQAVRTRYNLITDFVFYPAQFWPHKNHVYVLDALVALKNKHDVRLHAVFCGSDKGWGEHIFRTAGKLGIADQVHMLGFVPDDDIPALYEAAIALAFPTYFGPTNLPPVEAALLGCPVIYSDLPAFREQMGDAALYCDLRNPESMADQLYSLITDSALVERLRQAGYKRATALDESLYYHRLNKIIDDYAYMQRRWHA